MPKDHERPAEVEPPCSKLRDAIREVTGNRLIEHGFPVEIIDRISHVEFFYNRNDGRQTWIKLPGQAFRPDHLNVGFDSRIDYLGELTDEHYILTQTGLTLASGDSIRDPRIELPEDFADRMADFLFTEQEDTISVTLLTNPQTVSEMNQA